MSEIEDESINLIITSPPYNTNIKYDVYNDQLEWGEYFRIVEQFISECVKKLAPSGRFFINIANLYRTPYINLTAKYHSFLEQKGLEMITQIIWLKGEQAFHSTAWGSYQLQTSPINRSSHEYIIGYCKPPFKREKPKNAIPDEWRKGEYELYSRDEWFIYPISKAESKHPAAFPLDIPYRIIKQFSFKGTDTVLDPFLGRGTTMMAAKMLNRNCIGYELSKKYCENAKNNLKRTDICTEQTQLLEYLEKKNKNVLRNDFSTEFDY